MSRAYVLVIPFAAMAAVSTLLSGCRADDRRPGGEPAVADGALAPIEGVPPPASSADAFPDAARAAAVYNRAGVPAGLEVAVFAGGCFWGMEELLRKADGVVSTEVGYAGGSGEDPSYEEVSTGTTGNAESVKVVFDPAKTTYEKLVAWFFRIHDPTTPNRQGHDTGSQYRSVIFYQSPEQGKVANDVKGRAERSGKLGGPIVTQIVPAAKFHRAEDYHQDYLQHHPGGYTCHFVRPDIF